MSNQLLRDAVRIPQDRTLTEHMQATLIRTSEPTPFVMHPLDAATLAAQPEWLTLVAFAKTAAMRPILLIDTDCKEGWLCSVGFTEQPKRSIAELTRDGGHLTGDAPEWEPVIREAREQGYTCILHTGQGSPYWSLTIGGAE